MREVIIERNTNETQIELTLNLDGAGRYQVDTGCGFLNHMLELFARHGRFDLVLTCHGDVETGHLLSTGAKFTRFLTIDNKKHYLQYKTNISSS